MGESACHKKCPVSRIFFFGGGGSEMGPGRGQKGPFQWTRKGKDKDGNCYISCTLVIHWFALRTLNEHCAKTTEDFCIL